MGSAALGRCGLQRYAVSIEARQGVGSLANAQRVIQMFIDNDAASSQCRAKACGWNLKDAIGELDGVVSLARRVHVEWRPSDRGRNACRNKRRAGLDCRDNEFAIELSD